MKKIPNMEKWGKEEARERYGSANGSLNSAPKANDLQAPQDIQDKHEPGYSNDVKSWAHHGGDTRPGFDKKGSRG